MPDSPGQTHRWTAGCKKHNNYIVVFGVISGDQAFFRNAETYCSFRLGRTSCPILTAFRFRVSKWKFLKYTQKTPSSKMLVVICMITWASELALRLVKLIFDLPHKLLIFSPSIVKFQLLLIIYAPPSSLFLCRTWTTQSCYCCT